MAYTLGEATKATGISKTSLHRAIKSGRISATKNTLGEWEIDPAELHRVYPPATNRNSSSDKTLEQSGTVSEIASLRRELQLKDEERQRERVQLEGTIDDLRRRLDRESEERRQAQAQMTALLTDQSQTRPKPRHWMLPSVIAVAVLVGLLLLIAHWELVRSASP